MSNTKSDGQNGLTNHNGVPEKQPPQPPVDETGPPDLSGVGIDLDGSGNPEEIELDDPSDTDGSENSSEGSGDPEDVEAEGDPEDVEAEAGDPEDLQAPVDQPVSPEAD